MPPATASKTETQATTQSPPSEIFYKAKTNLGAFHKDGIFSRSQFITMNPIKGRNSDHQARIDAEIDPATYHEDLLAMHLMTGKIEIDKSATEAGEIPEGPHTLLLGATGHKKNSGIARSLQAAMESKSRAEAQKTADAEQVKKNLDIKPQ